MCKAVQVELREDMASKRADLERQTQMAAKAGAELTLTRRKLQDAAAALAEARAAAAARCSDIEHGAAALQREQQEGSRLRAALAAAQQEASRSKNLRAAQVPLLACCGGCCAPLCGRCCHPGGRVSAATDPGWSQSSWSALKCVQAWHALTPPAATRWLRALERSLHGSRRPM